MPQVRALTPQLATLTALASSVNFSLPNGVWIGAWPVQLDGFPTRTDSVLRYLLERNAQEAADEVSVKFESGGVWTRRDCRDAAFEAANQLRALGVRQGDRVAILLPNGEDFVRAWWGVVCLGATIVPINPVLRGPMLDRVLARAELVAVIVDDQRASQLDAATNAPALRIHPSQLRGHDRSAPELQRPIEPWDTFALILTSGTTGPSKLVSVSYMFFVFGAMSFFVAEGFDKHDVFLVDLPMFHMAALCYLGGSLVTRTQVAVRTRPALDRYWEVAREVGATGAILLSTMTNQLVIAPSRPAEREHHLRTVLMSPMPADPTAFRQRFGIEKIFTTFGMSEAPSVFRGDGDGVSDLKGYVGRLYPGYQARLVDQFDVEVEAGRPGELIIRADLPWVISPCYFGDPAGTATAWRNGWFHSGDVMRLDSRGDYYFVDRAKDALRRRGEMISAFEVEVVVVDHPAVRETACVAVPSDSGVDDEVKVWIVTEDDEPVNFEELLRYCHGRLPYYMVPRYFEVISELPKTPTQRVQKNVLRDRGNGPGTWDREAHGFSVTRHGLKSVART